MQQESDEVFAAGSDTLDCEGAGPLRCIAVNQRYQNAINKKKTSGSDKKLEQAINALDSTKVQIRQSESRRATDVDNAANTRKQQRALEEEISKAEHEYGHCP